jgi:hypothetical protein
VKHRVEIYLRSDGRQVGVEGEEHVSVNIEVNLKGIECEVVGWIELA